MPCGASHSLTVVFHISMQSISAVALQALPGCKRAKACFGVADAGALFGTCSRIHVGALESSIALASALLREASGTCSPGAFLA